MEFIVVIVLACSALAVAEWTSPFFITERGDVEIKLRATDYVSISMEEEIAAPFTICYLNQYNGNESPRIAQFSEGDLINLGLKFQKFNDRWDMVISKKQDYENELNRRYIFDISIGQIIVTVDIIIVNIFDNSPFVTYDNPCSVPELTEPGYVSECTYKVTDPDGMTNNDIKFLIEGNFEEDKIFIFRLDNGPREEYSQNYKLIIQQTLYYDKRIFYSFRVKVTDAGNNSFLFNLIVEVEDVPNLPPMFIKIFASEQFPELESREFETKAIDGDTGINADICYQVEFEDDKDFSELISINRTSGKIYIEPIDRDTLKIDVYPFLIRAYECDDEDSWIRNSAVLLVEDINNNIPLVYFAESKNIIEIDEETFYTLFQIEELTIEDRDLGKNAMYSVILKPEKFAVALKITPEKGYQLQGFSISIINARMLDYENEEFQKFNVSIVAAEEFEQEHWSEKTFEIHLQNWNDELPAFEKELYIFDVREDVGAFYEIGNVKAIDRDIGDSIEYYLHDKTNEKFIINLNTGFLSTILDGTFDYEQQEEITFQVFARDTLQTKNEPTHTTSTQIQINVIDVNDTPPTINLPKKFLTVKENDVFALITDEIEVYDPDTTADLRLFIDWNTTVATGLNVQREDFKECIDILGESSNNNNLQGTLKSSATKIIDYEKFQVLFLTLTAIDLNTEINESSASAVLTVFIIDENDNAPEFVGNTLEAARSVIEEAESDIFVGFIHAFDIDGPGNNEITFSLIPHDQSTRSWIKIDSKSGELAVDKNKVIDCDVPKRFTLDYQINLSDGLWITSGNISINIIDVNNKVPQINPYREEIQIFENVSDIFLTKVDAFDLDRDHPHNTVQYSISYQGNSELQRYFSINLNTGDLRVNVLDEFNQLDRDTEPSEYFIPIYVEDNLGIGARNGIYTTVHIILLDVNDNAPKMPPSLDLTIVPIYETLEKDITIAEHFYAPDIDEGLNGEVLYEILSIEPVEIDREDAKDYDNIFVLENYGNKYTRIRTGKDLKGYSGTWRIEIMAVDRGNETEGGFSLSSTASYDLVISSYNFNAPQIINPTRDGMIFRFDSNTAEVGRFLTLMNGSRLSSFRALDDDVGVFGDISFEIESDQNKTFTFYKVDEKSSDLVLVSPVEEKIYELSIIAVDGGNLRSGKMTVFLAFVDKTSEPYFESNNWSTSFTENQTGLDEFRVFPEAFDSKNVGVSAEEFEFEIYYYLDESYRPEDTQFFRLDSGSRKLQLKQMLDRESVENHSIRIIASNEEEMPPIRFVSEKSMLYINITVEDVNDNPPSFLYKSYATGISESDNLGRILITLEANDPDLDDVVTYFILEDTMTVSNPKLDYLKESAFQLNKYSGALTLNFEVQSTMSGYFHFQAEARDLVLHTDTTDIKIFLVADANRVKFVFLNTVEEVKNADQLTLGRIFSEAYDADCVIDDISPHQPSSGTVDETQTDLRVHFIKDNEAINADTISQKSSDITFITELSSRLNLVLSLKLKGLPMYVGDDDKEPINNKVLDITLVTISSVLLVILTAVIIIYIIQRRNYKRQIKALSEKKSDIDHAKFNNVKALPNTNIYSGQNNMFNPVMGDRTDTDLDTKSIISTDSDDFGDLSKNQIFNININPKTNDDNTTYA